MENLRVIADEQAELSQLIENRLPHQEANADYMNSIFNGVYAIAGIVAVVFIIIGGVQYITASGDTGKVVKAKNTIMYSVIGLVIVILAAAITGFLIQTISGAKG